MIVRVSYMPSTQTLIYDDPLVIYVNDPIIDPLTSYVPTSGNRDTPIIPPVDTRKRRMTITETVGSYTVTTTTPSTKLDDYELTTGFNYDETNLTISVFDGDYNNLTNKPSLITTTDINHTSNYVSR
jgi:hypothetical protein